MVRIRVRIIEHDGAPKKHFVWEGLHKAKAFVYKVVQAKEAFYLITDNEQAELILRDHIREFWREKGLEAQAPPELVASRTILVRGLEWCVAEQSEIHLKNKIEAEYPDWKLEKVIKIPNNDKLMKLICSNIRTANDILDKEFVVYNKRSQGGHWRGRCISISHLVLNVINMNIVRRNVRPLRVLKSALNVPRRDTGTTNALAK